MLSKNIPEAIAGYNVRSFQRTDGGVTATLYKGKNKVADITASEDNIDIKFKNEKEELAYQDAIKKNNLDKDFVSTLLYRAELKEFEDELRKDCQTMTVFTLKDDPYTVRRFKIRYDKGGKEWLNKTFGDKVDICYNEELR